VEEFEVAIGVINGVVIVPDAAEAGRRLRLERRILFGEHRQHLALLAPMDARRPQRSSQCAILAFCSSMESTFSWRHLDDHPWLHNAGQ
jgi:hypothetical protein